MSSASSRALLGFVAAALAVLIFHQGAVALLHAAKVVSFTAYSTARVPPFGVPRVLDLAFWGGVWGVLYALILPRLPVPLWVSGIGLGIAAALISMFVVSPLKGGGPGYGWNLRAMEMSLLINAFWGFGTGLILPLLAPRTRAEPRAGH